MRDSTSISAHFLESFSRAGLRTTPYCHWLPKNILPDTTCREIDALPIVPPVIEDTQGRREMHNSTRLFFNAAQQKQHKVCHDIAVALQSQTVTEALEEGCAVNLNGSYLRIEYCLDTDGFWLEPHTDIGAKFLTMLIYLSDPPADEDWGTDIYSGRTEFFGTAPFVRNHRLVFIPGANTWHGFRKRNISGIRRSLIVNYVTKDWRARHELAFPEPPLP